MFGRLFVFVTLAFAAQELFALEESIYPPGVPYEPGLIFEPAVDPSLTGFSPLDPNGDGYITSTGVAFSELIDDESQEFENGEDWNVIWHYQAEPTSDLDTGSNCGATEIVDNPNPNTSEHAAFFKIVDPDADLTNRNEILVFRIRIAAAASGAFGYSILLDTDQSFGADDANAVSGNPGFELEVLYGSGGGASGVTLQDVDGVTSGFTPLSYHANGVRNQWSYAKFSNCGGEPVFLDYYVSFADFPAGINATTPLRLVFASSSSPSTALGGSASDIGGVNDDDPTLSSDDDAFTAVVTNTPIVTFGTGYLTTECNDPSACNYDASSVTNTDCVYAQTWYLDADGDGLGVLLSDSLSCTQPVNYVSDSSDLCDDNTACNFDGNVVNEACVFPQTWYLDADGDGLGALLSDSTSCTQPTGYISDSSDLCDDNTACNFDGDIVNEACVFPQTWYLDADGDGLGVLLSDSVACSQPTNYVIDSTDLCDDNTACNYDGTTVTNEACTYGTTWYLDADGDGLGVLLSDSVACSQPTDYVIDSTDLCDDNTACNYDGTTVTNEACTYATTWYLDADGDGLGVLLSDSVACSQPTDYVIDSTDNCDDLSAENYNAVGNPTCIYPATSLSDSLVVCTGSENLVIDLDTVHTHTGVTGYTLQTGFSTTYASASVAGSILTCVFSGEGVGADTLIVSAAVGAGTQPLRIYVEEAAYPQRTSSIRALAASFPGANDGAISFDMDGSYDSPVTVHFVGHQDEEMSSGVLQLPNETFIISGYTNVKGCTSLEPAISPSPTTSPQPLRILVPNAHCND